MLIGLLCAALAVALLFPRTPAGKALAQLMIVAPARLLSRLTWARGLFLLLLFSLAAGLIAYAHFEGLGIAASAGPDLFVWISAFDVMTYVDVLALTALLAVSVRLRAIHQAVRSVALKSGRWLLAAPRLMGARARSVKTRIRHHRASKTKDEGPAPGFAFA